MFKNISKRLKRSSVTPEAALQEYLGNNLIMVCLMGKLKLRNIFHTEFHGESYDLAVDVEDVEHLIDRGLIEDQHKDGMDIYAFKTKAYKFNVYPIRNMQSAKRGHLYYLCNKQERDLHSKIANMWATPIDRRRSIDYIMESIEENLYRLPG